MRIAPIAPPLPELLAPAGGMEAALAAFHFGADAVYLGLRRFSARAEAENFSPEQLGTLVAHAHALDRRRSVYVAVNTLILQRELPEVVRTLAAIEESGADGIILQDLAVARIARRHFPALALHASTQMAIHSKEGAEALARMGFRRAVLARELTLEEIADISSLPELETEVFLHGALCYAVSGLCLCSSLLCGKSGNRGACAYPCRDTWRIEGGTFDPALKTGVSGHCFSMKDLALEDLTGRLREAGVASLKIEGRKKSPFYVAAAVDHYRHLLDGNLEGRESRAAAIRTVFSRPWTELFVRNRRNHATIDTSFVGHRGEAAGRVQSVVRNGGRTVLRFTAQRPIERHDGLQIEIPGADKPYGFGVDEMRLVEGGRAGAPCAAAPASALVEVTLPPDAPRISAGMEIRHSASNAVRRALSFAPPNLSGVRRRWPLDLRLRLSQDRLEAAGSVRAFGEILEETAILEGPFPPAADASKTEPGLRRAFQKLGDTPFSAGELQLEGDRGVLVPASRLNTLRRTLTARLGAQLDKARERRAETAAALVSAGSARDEASDAEIPPRGPSAWLLRTDRLEHLTAFQGDDWDSADEFLIEIPLGKDAAPAWQRSLAASGIPAHKVRWALPAFSRPPENEVIEASLRALAELGFRRFEAANLSALTFLRRTCPEADLSADWQLSVINAQAWEELREKGLTRVTLSPEDSLENWRMLGADVLQNAAAVVYQDTPLFISESCPHAALLGRCPGPDKCRFRSFSLSNGKGARLDVFSRRCRTFAVSAKPLNLTRDLRKIEALGLGWIRADFAVRPYRPEDVRRLWLAVRSGDALPGGQSANFRRGFWTPAASPKSDRGTALPKASAEG